MDRSSITISFSVTKVQSLSLPWMAIPPSGPPITCTHTLEHTHTHTHTHTTFQQEVCIILGVGDKKNARSQSKPTPKYHFIPKT